MKYKILIFLCLSAKMLFAQDVVFRTSIENLRLREQPNLESKVIKTVPKGTRLQWSGIRSEQKVSADWKGMKVADYWYKVQTYQDTMAWVFGKGIELYTIHDKDFKAFNNIDSFDYQLDNEWIKIETSNKKNFDNLPLFTTKWKKHERKEKEYEKPFSLTFENGRKQNFNATSEDEPHWLDGELPEQGYYLLGGGICCSVTDLVRKSDGAFFDFEFPLFTQKENLILSPNKKIIITKIDCEPGGTDGIAFYRFEEKSVERLVFIQTFPARYFRFISEKSGIAKLQNGTYWKIMLK
jgi:hypothetical protein